MMPQCTFNDYTIRLRLENSLFVANDRIISLERLLASKDYIIYHMISCNAFMAKSSPSFSPPLPPLPNNSPINKGNYNANKLFEDGQLSKKSHSSQCNGVGVF